MLPALTDRGSQVFAGERRPRLGRIGNANLSSHRIVLAIVVCSTVLVGCSHPASGPSGIKGDLVYSGGPEQSSPMPEPGSVIAYAEDGTQKAATTFEQGHGFSLPLPPGTYKLAATSGSAYCPSTTVTVGSGGFQSVRITCSVK